MIYSSIQDEGQPLTHKSCGKFQSIKALGIHIQPLGYMSEEYKPHKKTSQNFQ